MVLFKMNGSNTQFTLIYCCEYIYCLLAKDNFFDEIHNFPTNHYFFKRKVVGAIIHIDAIRLIDLHTDWNCHA